nr:hypothetical protein Iba_chr05bCG0130 [Ipomoea batatas]
MKGRVENRRLRFNGSKVVWLNEKDQGWGGQPRYTRIGIGRVIGKRKKWYLSGYKGEISGIEASSRTSLAPVEEAVGVVGVAGYAEGVDDAGGKHVLFETIGAAIAVEAREDEPHCSEVVMRLPAESVQKLSELGLF